MDVFEVVVEIFEVVVGGFRSFLLLVLTGHQQREANYRGSAKEEEVSRVLSGFSLTLGPRTNSNFVFYQSSFDTSFRF